MKPLKNMTDLIKQLEDQKAENMKLIEKHEADVKALKEANKALDKAIKALAK
ncbi:MAG TPA: hypothetical protein VGK47_13735 [Nitrososphaeraceae archaeon]